MDCDCVIALARKIGALAPDHQPVVWHVSESVAFVIGERADGQRVCAIRIGDTVIGTVVLRAQPAKLTSYTTSYSIAGAGLSTLTITRVGARAWLKVSSPGPSVSADVATAETIAEAAELDGLDTAVIRVGASEWLTISSPGPSVASAEATKFLGELGRALDAIGAHPPAGREHLARLALESHQRLLEARAERSCTTLTAPAEGLAAARPAARV